MPNKLLIIGNSPSVLNYQLGRKIDAEFHVVVRLNNFKIDGYQHHIGSKCTHAFITFATHYSQDLASQPKNQIHLFAAEKSKDISFLTQRMMRPDGCQIPPSSINILSPRYYAPLNEKIGLIGKERCSIGLIALQWAKDHYIHDDLYYHGIGFFSDATHTIPHYTGHTTPLDGYHAKKKESAYFKNYLESHFKKLIE